MNLAITGRHLEITEAMRNRIQDKLLKLDRFHSKITEANVILSMERYQHVAEILLQVNGSTISGIGKTEDMYTSLDRALEKVEGQLRRHKDKLDSLKIRQGARNKANSHIPIQAEGVAQAEAGEEKLMAEMSQQVADKPMTADEAALQLGQSEKSFLAFTNAQTEQVNVIYRRRDGKLGLIEPES